MSAEQFTLKYCWWTCYDVDEAFLRAEIRLQGLLAPENYDELRNILDWLSAQVKEHGTEKLRAAFVEGVEDLMNELDEYRVLAKELADTQREASDYARKAEMWEEKYYDLKESAE